MIQNPSSGSIRIQWKGQADFTGEAVLVNGVGRVIYRDLLPKGRNWDIDVPKQINSGIYYLLIFDEGREMISSERIILKPNDF